MKFLSRSEEFVLLAVLYLQEEAYGVAIRDRLRKMTGESWAFGAVFVMLSRLEKADARVPPGRPEPAPGREEQAHLQPDIGQTRENWPRSGRPRRRPGKAFPRPTRRGDRAQTVSLAPAPRLAEWLLGRLFRTPGLLHARDPGRGVPGAGGSARGLPGPALVSLRAARSLPYLLKDILYWKVSMIRNYLVIALRLIRRHKVYSFINVAGLAVSMACALLIVFWVRDELSYDKFNVHLDRLYRVTCVGEVYSGFSSPAPFAPAVAAEVPEVAAAARVGRNPRLVFRQGDRAFYESDGISTDAELFAMFSFPLVKGDAATALAGPSGIVISESMARKYFGDEDPIGRTLSCEGRFPLSVGGVMADVPATRTCASTTRSRSSSPRRPSSGAWPGATSIS